MFVRIREVGAGEDGEYAEEQNRAAHTHHHSANVRKETMTRHRGEMGEQGLR